MRTNVTGRVVAGAVFWPCLGFLAVFLLNRVLDSPVPAIKNECSLYLKTWYTMQRAYLVEKNAYSVLTAEVGFSPDRGNHYAYLSGPGPLEDRSAEQARVDPRTEGIGVDTARRSVKTVSFEQLPSDVASSLGMSGECPRCDITLACAGYVFSDEELDVWTISTRERQARNGSTLPAGVPVHHAGGTAE